MLRPALLIPVLQLSNHLLNSLNSFSEQEINEEQKSISNTSKLTPRRDGAEALTSKLTPQRDGAEALISKHLIT